MKKDNSKFMMIAVAILLVIVSITTIVCLGKTKKVDTKPIESTEQETDAETNETNKTVLCEDCIKNGSIRTIPIYSYNYAFSSSFELQFPSYDAEETYSLIPWELFEIDPQIYNSGSEPMYALISVTVPRDDVVIKIDNDGKSVENPELQNTELFDFVIIDEESEAYDGVKPLEVGINDGWKEVVTQENDNNTVTHVFAYVQENGDLAQLAADDTTPKLFNYIRLCNYEKADDVCLWKNFSTFRIDAYGMQSVVRNESSEDTDRMLRMLNIITDMGTKTEITY